MPINPVSSEYSTLYFYCRAAIQFITYNWDLSFKSIQWPPSHQAYWFNDMRDTKWPSNRLYCLVESTLFLGQRECMHNATVLNKAFYKFINNGAGRIFWSQNANPYLKYMANFTRTESCPLHYLGQYNKINLPPGGYLGNRED